MRPNPSLADLLDLARQVLRDDVAGDLSGGARYKALMAANAMAIVGRQITAGDEPAAAARARLVTILGRSGTLLELEAVLAKTLRDGSLPADQTGAVHAYLVETTRTKLGESNPRALDKA